MTTPPFTTAELLDALIERGRQLAAAHNRAERLDAQMAHYRFAYHVACAVVLAFLAVLSVQAAPVIIGWWAS